MSKLAAELDKKAYREMRHNNPGRSRSVEQKQIVRNDSNCAPLSARSQLITGDTYRSYQPISLVLGFLKIRYILLHCYFELSLRIKNIMSYD